MTVLAVVTGGSAGLGRALLATAPAGTHRLDVSRSGPPEVADEHLAADLADPSAWPQVATELGRVIRRAAWDRIVVVHNAGALDPIGFAGETDPIAYTSNVLLNSAAPQVLGHLLLGELMPLAGRRELVLVSSGAATSAYAGWSAYGAGKAAVDQWVRTVGEEQRRRGGVRVLSVAPGVVATRMQERIRDMSERDFPEVERFRQLYRDGRLLEPQEAARRLWTMLDDEGVTTGDVVGLSRYARP